MTELDWEFLLEAALIHKMIYDRAVAETLRPNELTTLLAELRRRGAALGATLEDRMKLRIRIVDEVADEDKVLRATQEVIDYAAEIEGLLNAEE
jgi:hypothetical protein